MLCDHTYWSMSDEIADIQPSEAILTLFEKMINSKAAISAKLNI
jgi:hypothetical protein